MTELIVLPVGLLILFIVAAFLAGWFLGWPVLRWLDRHAEQDRLSEESEAETARFRTHCELQGDSYRRMMQKMRPLE